MGAVTSFLSPAMINGFTSGSAFHVLTSQIPTSLGITLKKQEQGFGELIRVGSVSLSLLLHIQSMNVFRRFLFLERI